MYNYEYIYIKYEYMIYLKTKYDKFVDFIIL